jgi:hypothetical protein
VYAAKGLLGMLSKLAATVLLSIVVLIGVICGTIAVLTVRAVSWYGRSGERSGDED